MNKPRQYAAYTTREIKVNKPNSKEKMVIPKDTLIWIDVDTHVAYYNAYKVQLVRNAYQVVN